MSLRGVLIAAATAAVMLWANDRGIRPRPTPEDYPARQKLEGVTLAAAVLTPEQVKKRFAVDLNRGYLVVEVAVFPEPGRDIDIATRDFLARFASGTDTERPLGAQAIAARLGKKDSPPPTLDPSGRVHVYTVETIGYEHGPNGRGGVYTGTGTGVAIGPPGSTPPPSAPPTGTSRYEVQQELESMALPEGRISDETAGYIYLAKPTKAKSSPLRLTYYGASGKIELNVPFK